MNKLLAATALALVPLAGLAGTIAVLLGSVLSGAIKEAVGRLRPPFADPSFIAATAVSSPTVPDTRMKGTSRPLSWSSRSAHVPSNRGIE